MWCCYQFVTLIMWSEASKGARQNKMVRTSVGNASEITPRIIRDNYLELFTLLTVSRYLKLRKYY